MVCSDRLRNQEATKLIMKRQSKPYFETATNVSFKKHGPIFNVENDGNYPTIIFSRYRKNCRLR